MRPARSRRCSRDRFFPSARGRHSFVRFLTQVVENAPHREQKRKRPQAQRWCPRACHVRAHPVPPSVFTEDRKHLLHRKRPVASSKDCRCSPGLHVARLPAASSAFLPNLSRGPSGREQATDVMKRSVAYATAWDLTTSSYASLSCGCFLAPILAFKSAKEFALHPSH